MNAEPLIRSRGSSGGLRCRLSLKGVCEIRSLRDEVVGRDRRERCESDVEALEGGCGR